MDTFKKIYKALIIMTIISIIVLCLSSLGMFDTSVKMTTNGPDTTGLYIYLIALCIGVMSFVFSRAANVIANRKNTIFGYLTVFAGLIILLILAIILIFKPELNANILKFISILINIVILLTLIVLVFEVPQANNSHGTFQKLTAILIAGTFIFNWVTSNNTNINTSSLSSSNISSETSSSSTSKIKTILFYTSLGAFLINPMLRVLYIDKDYSQIEELDNLIEHATEKYKENGNNPNPNAVISDKYKNPDVTAPKKEVPKPIPVAPQQVIIEEKHEKVVNPNFKQEELPEAIIPSINAGGESAVEVTNTVPQEIENVTPVEQVIESPQAPVIETQPVPVENVTPTEPSIEQPQEQQVTPTAEAKPVEVSTPLEQVAQPTQEVTQVQQEQTQTVEVSTPLDQVVQPHQNQ